MYYGMMPAVTWRADASSSSPIDQIDRGKRTAAGPVMQENPSAELISTDCHPCSTFPVHL